ncbi:MAG: hypothetical protein V4613_14140 [Bacteroidota bacterium]
MNYQSPLYILDDFEIDVKTINFEEIVRLRKKLLAEFNLSGETTIAIKNKQYTKDEVIKQIDALKNLDDLETHILLFRNPELLNFCENPKKAHNPAKVLKAFFDKPEITEKCKQIIVDAELQALKYHLNNLDFLWPHEIIKFFNRTGYLYADEASNIIDANLLYLVDYIDEINEDNYAEQDQARMRFLKTLDFYFFLNEMQEDFFDIRDSIAGSIINLTVRLQPVDLDFVKNVSRPLRQLECEPVNMQLIKSNHQAFHSKKSIDIHWFWYALGFLLLRGCLSAI